MEKDKRGCFPRPSEERFLVQNDEFCHFLGQMKSNFRPKESFLGRNSKNSWSFRFSSGAILQGGGFSGIGGDRETSGHF